MTEWADVSQYQSIPVDDRYPHRVFCFRTNSGDRTDTLADVNARRAGAMLAAGRLDIVIAYYFFRPGQANCDLHREILEKAGLWGNRALVTMVDVEDAGGEIRGDHSTEINDEVERLRRWFGDPRRVIGYLNAVANPGLWTRRPAGLRFVTPNYTRKPGELSANVPEWMRRDMFAHQYTDTGRCAPWPNGVDLNHSPLTVPQLKALLGIGEPEMPNATPEQVKVITAGARQLHNAAGTVRKAPKWLVRFLPDSFAVHRDGKRTDEGSDSPWPNDMFAALTNELVTGMFNLTDPVDFLDGNGPVPLTAIPADQQVNVVTLLRILGARQLEILKHLEGK
ncbi:lysin A, glycosyl hydrolase domain [Gordonia phage Hibiscus]